MRLPASALSLGAVTNTLQGGHRTNHPTITRTPIAQPLQLVVSVSVRRESQARAVGKRRPAKGKTVVKAWCVVVRERSGRLNHSLTFLRETAMNTTINMNHLAAGCGKPS